MFGTQGLKMLATGLSMNTSLDKLSLNYCGIDDKGSILSTINFSKFRFKNNIFKTSRQSINEQRNLLTI